MRALLLGVPLIALLLAVLFSAHRSSLKTRQSSQETGLSDGPDGLGPSKMEDSKKSPPLSGHDAVRDLVDLVNAVLEDREESDTLIGLLQSFHHEMMVSSDRSTLLSDLKAIAHDEQAQGPTRFLALILLGGWDTSPAPTMGGLIHHVDERLALACVFSRVMNAVVPLERNATGALVDPNGKAQAAFWIDVLQRLGRMYDPRLRPQKTTQGTGLSTSLVFWNCLGDVESQELIDRTRNIVRKGTDERIRGTLFALLVKEKTRAQNVDLARDMVLDSGAPRSLRDTGVIALSSVCPTGWSNELVRVMQTDRDTELCQWIFTILRAKAPDTIVGFISSESCVSYLLKLRQSSKSGSEVARFYGEVLSMEIDDAPRLAIQLLAKESDASIRVKTASSLSNPSPVVRLTAARVHVLRALCEDEDARVAESAALGLAKQATSEEYPGSKLERIHLLEHAERTLGATLAQTPDGSAERSRMQDELSRVVSAKKRLSGE